MADFTELLKSILSASAEERNLAEERLETLSISEKFQHLINAIRNDQNSVDIKGLAAVLLRRIVLKNPDQISEVNDVLMIACRAELLQALQTEQEGSIRRKICDAIAEVARIAIDEDGVNHWPELLQFLFTCCSLEHPQMYESALQIVKIVPAVFANQLESYINIVKHMLLQALLSQHNSLADEAFAAASGFIVSLEVPVMKLGLGDLLEPMMNVLELNIQKEDNDAVLNSLIDLAEHRPKYLRSQLERLLEVLLKTAQTEEMEDTWRQLAMECVVTLAENAAPMVRKHTRFLPHIVETAVKFMLDVEDDEGWSTSEDIGEDEDSLSNSIAGETALDRLATALGGKAVLPHIVKLIPSMLVAPEWQRRYSALMAISAVAEGCEKQMVSILGEVVTSVLPYCQDPHHRVRYAACNALGQLSTDFATRIQGDFHGKIIPALLGVLDDFPNPRVQTHAGAALVNFCEHCSKETLAPYLEAIVVKLENVFKIRLQELIEKGHKLVVEQMVTTLSVVADSSEELFTPYYDRFIPSLKFILSNANEKQYRLLRGKTMECISFIGLAVGKERFMTDAQEVLEVLFKVQSEYMQWEPDDPQISYMIGSWARMCKIIGPAFVQFLPHVIHPLLQAAAVKPEIAIVDSIEAEQNFREEDGWEFITLADQQKFGIKTAGMDDKCTAMHMLVVYAKDLKEGFADYALMVAKIMIPHLRFYFHEMVRAAAAEIIPYLLECVQSTGQEAMAEMWSLICDKLLEAIPLEPDPEISGMMMDSLCKCIDLLGVNCFTIEQYGRIVEILKEQLENCFQRQKSQLLKRQDEDYDEQVEEELEAESETDDLAMRKVADVMHILFATHGSTLLPIFEQMLPILVEMLQEEHPSSHKQWALCMFDDLLEFASQSAIKYQEYFLQPMISCISDTYAPTRQAAAYGVGVMAEKCSKEFSKACLDALPLLVASVQSSNAREDHLGIHATENAISAVAKICKYLESEVPLDSVLPMWLSWLPVVEDKEEACHVYSYLCDLIERNNVYILGENNLNVPKILGIIGDVVSNQILSDNEQVLHRMLAIARHIQASGEVWDSCLQYLSKKQQSALLTALSS